MISWSEKQLRQEIWDDTQEQARQNLRNDTHNLLGFLKNLDKEKIVPYLKNILKNLQKSLGELKSNRAISATISIMEECITEINKEETNSDKTIKLLTKFLNILDSVRKEQVIQQLREGTSHLNNPPLLDFWNNLHDEKTSLLPYLKNILKNLQKSLGELKIDQVKSNQAISEMGECITEINKEETSLDKTIEFSTKFVKNFYVVHGAIRDHKWVAWVTPNSTSDLFGLNKSLQSLQISNSEVQNRSTPSSSTPRNS